MRFFSKELRSSYRVFAWFMTAIGVVSVLLAAPTFMSSGVTFFSFFAAVMGGVVAGGCLAYLVLLDAWVRDEKVQEEKQGNQLQDKK